MGPSAQLKSKLTVVGQKVQLSFQGAAGVMYQIEATEDFQHWTPVLTTNLVANGPIALTFKDPKPYAKRFFRIAQFPQVYLVGSGISVANSIALAWNSSADPNIVGYNVCVGTANGDCINKLDVANLNNVTLAGFLPGTTYHFIVRGYDSLGNQSPPIKEIVYESPGVPSSTLNPALTVVDQKTVRFIFQGAVGVLYRIEATEDLRNWTTLITTNFTANSPVSLTLKDSKSYAKRFFRIAQFSQVYSVGSGISVANSIGVAWDLSPGTNVVGYNVYVRTADGSYTNKLNAGNLTNMTCAGLLPGTSYHFTVRSYDASGKESSPLKEIVYEAPGAPSPGLKAALTLVDQNTVRFNFQETVGVLYRIEAAEDLRNWTPVLTTNFNANSPVTLTLRDFKRYAKRFFRIAQFPQAYVVGPGISVAKSIAVAWGTSSNPNIVGYNVYIETSDGSYTNKLNAANLISITLAGLQPGTSYHLTVKGYDASGNEGPTVKEIVYETPGAPSPALNAALTVVDQKTVRFNFQGTVGVLYQIEATEDLRNWTPVLATNFTANSPVTLTLRDSKPYANRFFRIAQFPQN